MQDISLNKASTDERIDPATEDLQRDLLTEFGRNSKRSTNDIQFQAIALAASVVGMPIGHGCNSVKFWTSLSDCYVGNAAGQPVLIVASIWTEIPINNTGLLRFVSVTGGAVYLISSN